MAKECRSGTVRRENRKLSFEVPARFASRKQPTDDAVPADFESANKASTEKTSGAGENEAAGGSGVNEAASGVGENGAASERLETSDAWDAPESEAAYRTDERE